MLNDVPQQQQCSATMFSNNVQQQRQCSTTATMFSDNVPQQCTTTTTATELFMMAYLLCSISCLIVHFVPYYVSFNFTTFSITPSDRIFRSYVLYVFNRYVIFACTFSIIHFQSYVLYAFNLTTFSIMHFPIALFDRAFYMLLALRYFRLYLFHMVCL